MNFSTEERGRRSFRAGAKRTTELNLPPIIIGANHYTSEITMDRAFFGYVFPFTGVLTNGVIVIDSLSSGKAKLLVDLISVDGFHRDKVFIVGEGATTIEKLSVSKGDRIKATFIAGDEVGIEIKDVYISFTLIGGKNG